MRRRSSRWVRETLRGENPPLNAAMTLLITGYDTSVWEMCEIEVQVSQFTEASPNEGKKANKPKSNQVAAAPQMIPPKNTPLSVADIAAKSAEAAEAKRRKQEQAKVKAAEAAEARRREQEQAKAKAVAIAKTNAVVAAKARASLVNG